MGGAFYFHMEEGWAMEIATTSNSRSGQGPVGQL
jgi:hypothetical protein